MVPWKKDPIYIIYIKEFEKLENTENRRKWKFVIPFANQLKFILSWLFPELWNHVYTSHKQRNINYSRAQSEIKVRITSCTAKHVEPIISGFSFSFNSSTEWPNCYKLQALHWNKLLHRKLLEACLNYLSHKKLTKLPLHKHHKKEFWSPLRSVQKGALKVSSSIQAAQGMM